MAVNEKKDDIFDESNQQEKNKSKKKNRLPVSKKIQLIIASMCTLAVMIGIPVYAWFSYQKQVADTSLHVSQQQALHISACGNQ